MNDRTTFITLIQQLLRRLRLIKEVDGRLQSHVANEANEANKANKETLPVKSSC